MSKSGSETWGTGWFLSGMARTVQRRLEITLRRPWMGTRTEPIPFMLSSPQPSARPEGWTATGRRWLRWGNPCCRDAGWPRTAATAPVPPAPTNSTVKGRYSPHLYLCTKKELCRRRLHPLQLWGRIWGCAEPDPGPGIATVQQALGLEPAQLKQAQGRSPHPTRSQAAQARFLHTGAMDQHQPVSVHAGGVCAPGPVPRPAHALE